VVTARADKPLASAVHTRKRTFIGLGQGHVVRPVNAGFKAIIWVCPSGPSRDGPLSTTRRNGRSDSVCFPCSSVPVVALKIAAVHHTEGDVGPLATAFDPTASVDSQFADREFW